jgi:hypothetical protein
MFWLIDTRPKNSQGSGGDHFVSPGGLQAWALYVVIHYILDSLSLPLSPFPHIVQ